MQRGADAAISTDINQCPVGMIGFSFFFYNFWQVHYNFMARRWRRGWDSNPRYAKRTTVFETAPFDHSGTSPRPPGPRAPVNFASPAYGVRRAGGSAEGRAMALQAQAGAAIRFAGADIRLRPGSNIPTGSLPKKELDARTRTLYEQIASSAGGGLRSPGRRCGFGRQSESAKKHGVQTGLFCPGGGAAERRERPSRRNMTFHDMCESRCGIFRDASFETRL